MVKGAARLAVHQPGFSPAAWLAIQPPRWMSLQFCILISLLRNDTRSFPVLRFYKVFNSSSNQESGKGAFHRHNFAIIKFDCLFDINEQIFLVFVLQFYKSVRLIQNANGTLSITFIIRNVEIYLRLEEFSQILRVPCEGVCMFTTNWAISYLLNSMDSNPEFYPVPTEDPLVIHDTLFYARPPGKTRKVKGKPIVLDPF
ncbi:hypothetical protein Tco_0149229 [Tanacetum coccineum]